LLSFFRNRSQRKLEYVIFQTANLDPGTRTDVLIYYVIGGGDDDSDGDCDLLIAVGIVLNILHV
jgi:hypothetical protein